MKGRQSLMNQLAGSTGMMALILICSSIGCCWQGTYGGGFRPSYSGPIVDVGCESCGEACGGSCGESLGASCERFPASCGGVGACGGLGRPAFPLFKNRLACGSGCGDVFWGEWISHPPDGCDACGPGGGWAGSDCDSSYASYGYRGGYGYGGGYGGGYGCGLLGGPVAVIQGTYLGVTNVVRGGFGLMYRGYDSLMYGYGPAYGYGSAYGYSDGPGVYSNSGCGACDGSGCDNCTASALPMANAMGAALPLGTGVRTARAEKETLVSNQAGRPSQRRINRRLRR